MYIDVHSPQTAEELARLLNQGDDSACLTYCMEYPDKAEADYYIISVITKKEDGRRLYKDGLLLWLELTEQGIRNSRSHRYLLKFKANTNLQEVVKDLIPKIRRLAKIKVF